MSAPAPPRLIAPDLPDAAQEQLRPIRWQLYLGFAGLALGGLMGLLQALERLDIHLYEAVGLQSYYQALTLHGVTLVIVFTFTFGNAFLQLATIKGYDRPLVSTAFVQASFWTAAAGTILAAIPMLANQANVLFTFYPPLQASPLFYIGAALLFVSTWLVLLNQVQTLRAWRADHAGERIPLLSYVSLLTYVMWGIASIGIAVQVLVFILPWTFGWTEGIDPQFSRILFWFTGHPIVYFWLLPVYVSWYLMIPKQVGGTLYSDGLVRLVFIMFLVLSLPVGVHHQFTDPGIPMSSKAIHYVLTVGVFFPSMVTAFTVMAALESGGRAAGGKGLLGWIRRLPWGDPSVAAQLVAMLTFVFGGISGLVNASLTVNVVVHNTAFVPGHFHLTVGSAVALSIIGISYWLVPYLTGKRLVGRRWALAQAWLWGAGALLFGRGQIAGGLDGMPRRVPITSASYELEAWASANLQTGIGGILMVVSGLMFVVLLVATLARGSAVAERIEIPVAEPAHGARESWRVLDNLGLWVLVTVLVTAFAYGHVLLHYLPMSPTSPGFQLW